MQLKLQYTILNGFEVLKNFDDEAAITYFNTFTHNSINSVWSTNNNCTFNPIDKVVELYVTLIKEKEAMIVELKFKKMQSIC